MAVAELPSEKTRKETTLWGFGQNSAPVALSKKVTLCLAKERGLTEQAAASLRMMEKRGHYVGRKVTFFRVFDPAVVAASGLSPRRFNDLDSGAFLHGGHVESDGHIVLNV